MLRGESFTHDLVAEAVASGVPAALARPLHAAIAAFLETHGGHPVRCAEHWHQSGEPERAVPHWLAAAAQARERRRYGEAAARGEQAARVLQTAGRREAAFSAWFSAAEDRTCFDDRAGAMSAYLPALRALARSDAERACLACVEVVDLFESGQTEAAEHCIQQALLLARRAGAHDIEGELLWDLTVVNFQRRDLGEAERLARTASACFDRVQPGQQRLRDSAATRGKLNGALAVFAKEAGRYAEAMQSLQLQLQLADAQDELRQQAIAAINLASLASDCGQLDEAGHWLVTAEQRRGDGTMPCTEQALLHAYTGLQRALCGQLQHAMAALLAPSVQHLGTGHRNRVLFHCTAAWLEAELGRRDLALARLRPLAAEAALPNVDRLMVQARLAQLGQAADAPALLRDLVAHSSPLVRARWLAAAAPGCPAETALPLLEAESRFQAQAGGWGLSLALDLQRVAALRRLGRVDEARALALAVWRLAEQGRQPPVLFPMLAGTVHQALHKQDEALAATVARRGTAWVKGAVTALPPEWQAPFLARCAQAGLPMLLGPAEPATPG